ncbi:MAG: DivIVA domain-containing protein [Micrococcales bacterium]|nr:DivIVA domain-containing protein [Micrococcales bacterium]
MADLFRRAKGSRGYDPREVDEFFQRAQAVYEGGTAGEMAPVDVRTVAFSQIRGGYDEGQVDGALDRLDVAFARKERSLFIAQHGQQAWLDKIVERATTLYDRLGRPAGQRFAPPDRGQYGYQIQQVDALMNRLSAYFNEGVALKSNEIRYAVFSPTKSKKSYGQAPVDAFLDRALEVLVAAE